jgi:hypothetical protein
MLRQVINQVIDNDPGFRKLSREALVGVTYTPASVSDAAVHLRAAYNNAVGSRPHEATEEARAAVDAARAAGDPALARWLGETYAAYVHLADPVMAQQALTDAGRDNHAVLKPRGGVEYRRISAPPPQAQQASAYLVGRYPTGDALILGFDAVLADLDWDNTRTPEAEAAIADLGLHLGFTSQQPERDFGIGSDALWAVGNHTYWVIEAKTGSNALKIWKTDINQLSGSVNWCRREYGADATVIPVIVHPNHVVEASGTPPQETRVITTKTFAALKYAVRQFSRAIAPDDAYRDPARVAGQLAALNLEPAALIAELTQLAYREPVKR